MAQLATRSDFDHASPDNPLLLFGRPVESFSFGRWIQSVMMDLLSGDFDMRAGLYYVVAALLLLATVPMYRYILSRTAPLRHPPSPPPSVAPVSRPARSVPVVKLWYAYNEPLPAGYRCSAANGIVYRTREERGSTVVEPLYRSGSVVRCGGDARSSYRR